MSNLKIRAKHIVVTYNLGNLLFDDEKLKLILDESLVFLQTKVKFSVYYFGVIKKHDNVIHFGVIKKYDNVILKYYLGSNFVQDFVDPSLFNLSLNCLKNLVLIGTYKECNFFSQFVRELHNESVFHITNISSDVIDLKDVKTPTRVEKFLKWFNKNVIIPLKPFI